MSIFNDPKAAFQNFLANVLDTPYAGPETVNVWNQSNTRAERACMDVRLGPVANVGLSTSNNASPTYRHDPFASESSVQTARAAGVREVGIDKVKTNTPG